MAELFATLLPETVPADAHRCRLWPGMAPLCPILAERPEPRQRFAVLLPVGCGFAGDDVVNVADGKAFLFHPPPPRVLESFDAVRRENQVQIERSVSELQD